MFEPVKNAVRLCVVERHILFVACELYVALQLDSQFYVCIPTYRTACIKTQLLYSSFPPSVGIVAVWPTALMSVVFSHKHTYVRVIRLTGRVVVVVAVADVKYVVSLGYTHICYTQTQH